MDYNLFDTVKRIWILGKCAIEIIYLLLLCIIQLLTLMVKLLEKGDLYSKIAMVSILLVICAVARGVKKKRKNALHGHSPYKMQRNVAKELDFRCFGIF